MTQQRDQCHGNSSRGLHRAALAVMATIAGAACQADVPVQDSQSNCFVSRNQEAINAGFRFIHSIPDHCPIDVPISGGRQQSYAGTMLVPKNSQASAVTTIFRDAANQYIIDFSTAFRDDPARADTLSAGVSGSYLAGRQGVHFGSGGPANVDYAIETATVRATGQEGQAQVNISYQAERVALQGPAAAYNDEYFTLSTLVKAPGAVEPISYEWFEDENSLGPSTANASTLTRLKYAGQYQYRVVATDAIGKTEQAYHAIIITDRPACANPPCADQ